MSTRMAVSFRYGSAQNIYFDTREAAEKELEALKGKMGKTYRFKNDAEDTHTISTPVGPLVVTLDNIDCARIVDMEVWSVLCREDEDREIGYAARLELAKKRAVE